MKFSLIRKFIKREKTLFILFLISFFLTLGINLIGKQINEPVYMPWASEFGDMISNLSIGYLVSYIFYFIVNFMKSESDKKNISEIVAWQINLILLKGYALHHNVFNSTNRKSFPASLEELKNVCQNMDSFESPLLVGSRRVHWNELLRNVRDEIQWSLNKLYPIYPFIDSELIGILTSIEKSQLFLVAEFEVIPTRKTLENQSYRGKEEMFHSFSILIYRLEQYFIENFESDYPEYNSQRLQRKGI